MMAAVDATPTVPGPLSSRGDGLHVRCGVVLESCEGLELIRWTGGHVRRRPAVLACYPPSKVVQLARLALFTNLRL